MSDTTKKAIEPLGELKKRDQLIEFFKDGMMPTGQHFRYLINSMANRIDDGITKGKSTGLNLSPGDSGEKLISFYKNIENRDEGWYIAYEQADDMGLVFGEYEPNEDDASHPKSEPHLYLKDGGNIGVGTKNPQHALDVSGYVGYEGRVGTYKNGQVPADGNWHTILTDLNACQAFEITARAGKPKHGKYALVHATALSTFGKSRSKIKTTQAHYGWFWNKIKFRWSGTTYNYSLQIKTRSNYGSENSIYFNVAKLWDDADLLPKESGVELKQN